MLTSHYISRFCVGDQFFLLDNKALCGADYEERMVFANLSANPAQLAQIKHATFPSSGAPRQGHVPLNNNSIPNESSSSQYFMDSSHSSNKDLTPLPPISSVRSSFLGGSAIQT